VSPRTLAQKVLSAHSGRDAEVGDLLVCRPDLVLGTDGARPMALE
jgi:3-isopropylmalate/(R)-2-methylmalate dehydratase large subunit